MEKEQYKVMRAQEDHHWWYAGMRRIVSVLIDCPRDGSSLRIVDAGCGTGATLRTLSQHGKVFGVDLSDEALRFCRERGLQTIFKGSIDRLPIGTSTVDILTCFDVIYHKAVTDDVQALREFYRVLRPGGKLLVRVPAYDWLRGTHDLSVHTRHRYTARELREKLALAGFRVERVTHANMIMLPVAVAKRVLESRGLALGSDLDEPHPILNRILAGLLGLEAHLVSRTNLPCGLSVMATGVKE